MKPLNPRQIEAIVHLIGETRDREFNCAECQKHVGEFAERQAASQGREFPHGDGAQHRVTTILPFAPPSPARSYGLFTPFLACAAVS